MLSNRGLMARSRQQPLEHRLLLTATFCLLAGGGGVVYSASSSRPPRGARGAPQAAAALPSPRRCFVAAQWPAPPAGPPRRTRR